jgi:hypothetical protein
MRQLVVYNGTVVQSDANNTFGAVVERDPITGQINIQIVNLTGMLIAGAGMSLKGLAITASQNADQTTTFWEVNSTSAAVQITLPAVATVPNQVYILIKTDASANNAGFKGSGSETINGSNTSNTNTQYGIIRVRANAAGTAWYQF